MTFLFVWIWVNILSFVVPLLLKASSGPLVNSPWGQIRGIHDITDDWNPFHAFLAVPYALPPTGYRRFAKPVPHPGFHGTSHVFNATKHGPTCLQAGFLPTSGQVEMKEDCLTLDIYTPVSVTHFSELPVVLFIHGGGFITGGSLAFPAGGYGGKGVIFVVIQYRLGPFGFLSTGDRSAPGNYGLWDQRLALQWVRSNIQAFGGDVNRITIMGESAGSASVAFQTLYEGNKGLFKRAILQSGAATSLWAINRDPVKTTYELAAKVGCHSSDSDHEGVVHCLRAAPAEKLRKLSWPMGHDPVSSMFDFFFVPTVDGDFVKYSPNDMMVNTSYLQSVGFSDIDCMIGLNSNEGSLLQIQAGATDGAFGTNLSMQLTDRVFFRNTVIPQLLERYFGGYSQDMIEVVDYELTYPETKSSKVSLEDVLDTSSDPSMIVPTIRFADVHSQLNGSGRTYMYLFDHTPSFLPHVVDGLPHGMDQIYVFGFPMAQLKAFLQNGTTVDPDEKRIANIMTPFLAEFARSGNPSSAVKVYTGTDWSEFTAANGDYFLLDKKPAMLTHPFMRRYQLWSELLPKMWENSKSSSGGQGKSNAPLVG